VASLEATCLSVQLRDFPTGRTYEVTLQLDQDRTLRFFDPDPKFEPQKVYAIEIAQEPIRDAPAEAVPAEAVPPLKLPAPPRAR
jgi:hypothetical protein